MTRPGAKHLRAVSTELDATGLTVGRTLLDGVTLDYGPTDLLGRFFLKADTAARDRGLILRFATLDDLVEVNRRNPETWRPLISIFDPRFGGINSGNSFVLLGRNLAGEVVMTQSARLYNWSKTNFADEATSLRLFYADPESQKLDGETVRVTAPRAGSITGSVVFSGGVWVRPDYRGRFLTAIMPRISRALAFTRWSTDLTMTMMAEAIVNKGVAQRCGYSDVEWDVSLEKTRFGAVRFAVLRMTTDEMLDDLGRFVEQFDAQIDRRIQDRAG